MIIDEKTKKALRQLANSRMWDVIRDGFFQKLVDEDIKDVTKPIIYGDKAIAAEKAFFAKVLTARKIEEMLKFIDGAKSSKKNSIESYE